MTSVAQAALHLRGGGLACFPTETVWGLACRADSPEAAAELRSAKGRPDAIPLAAAFATFDDAWPYVDVTPGARALAARFLPGPLSIVLRRSDEELAHLAPGHATLSIRVPDHPTAQEILRATGPLALTSANRHGEPDATDAESARQALSGAKGIVVVDAGPPCAGLPSTVVDASGDEPKVLREGSITAAEVAAAWP